MQIFAVVINEKTKLSDIRFRASERSIRKLVEPSSGFGIVLKFTIHSI